MDVVLRLPGALSHSMHSANSSSSSSTISNLLGHAVEDSGCASWISGALLQSFVCGPSGGRIIEDALWKTAVAISAMRSAEFFPSNSNNCSIRNCMANALASFTCDPVASTAIHSQAFCARAVASRTNHGSASPTYSWTIVKSTSVLTCDTGFCKYDSTFSYQHTFFILQTEARKQSQSWAAFRLSSGSIAVREACKGVSMCARSLAESSSGSLIDAKFITQAKSEQEAVEVVPPERNASMSSSTLVAKVSSTWASFFKVIGPGSFASMLCQSACMVEGSTFNTTWDSNTGPFWTERCWISLPSSFSLESFSLIAFPTRSLHCTSSGIGSSVTLTSSAPKLLAFNSPRQMSNCVSSGPWLGPRSRSSCRKLAAFSASCCPTSSWRPRHQSRQHCLARAISSALNFAVFNDRIWWLLSFSNSFSSRSSRDKHQATQCFWIQKSNFWTHAKEIGCFTFSIPEPNNHGGQR